jgi:predicted amidohydrolase
MLTGLEGVDWIVFPEMALSGFTMRVTAATWEAEDYDFFASLARERGSWVTVGAVEEGKNVALAFGPDGLIAARYAKRHLFSFSGEEKSYRPGESRVSYEVGPIRVAQAICYDLRFPYHFWPDAGSVDAYCVIAAWGGARAAQWNALLRARAIENQAWVIGVNRTGKEPSNCYAGLSAVYDPRGEEILSCGSAEGVFLVDIDPATASAWRSSFRAFGDRLE